MRRPQSAKPGFKGYWGQASSDQIGDPSVSSKNQHRQNIKIMKPDLTTHDFSRILPKKIHQDKERLYSQALQLKQTVNEFIEENIRLKTKISILEKEKDKMNRYIDSTSEGLTKQTNSRLNIYGPKSTDKQNMIVRNLKKIVRESRQENQYLKTQNQKIKKTVKYTKMNEIQIEKKIILDQNKKLGSLLEEYNSQMIFQEDVERQNEELKRYLEEQIEQTKLLSEDNEKYQEIVESLEQKIKAESQKFHTKEKKLQRDIAIEKRKTNQQYKYIEDLRKELKSLQANQEQANMKKKSVKPVMRPTSSHPSNYRSNLTQPKQNTLNIPNQEMETNVIKKKNEQLEIELNEIKIKLQKSENELSKRKPRESVLKENVEQLEPFPIKSRIQDKPIVIQKREDSQPSSKSKLQASKLEKKYDFDDSPEKEESYSNAFEPEAEAKYDEYDEEFEKMDESKLPKQVKKVKQDQQIEKLKKDFQQNQEEEQLYKKEESNGKKKKGEKGEEKNKKKVTAKGYKPDKALLTEIKQLLTYRMKSQRYPFQDLKADIKNAQSSTFSYTDLCNMLVNEPFYMTSNYTKIFLSYCFEKQSVEENDVLQSTVLMAKLRKVVDDFELMEESEEKQMILRIAEMTSTYPYELETAFENVKNGEDTIGRQDLITMFQKLELQDKYIELIIAELSLCSDDLEHLNFHGFFERFYIEEEEDGLGQPTAIEEQGEESEDSYKNTSRGKKKSTNTRKASQELDEKMGKYMLAAEQPIESKNYAYDEDIVSDDGRI